ncbi:stage II sporulation protein M [Lachnospiraceae bacterium 46-61]
MQRKINKQEKRQMMILMICLFFLFSVAAGAVLANGISIEEVHTMQGDIENLFQNQKQTEKSFLTVFLKYLKYDVLIWTGGCFCYGAALSAATLAFRGVSLGYTAAVVFRAYGVKGIFVVICSMLPQNLILLPVYFLMTWFAYCFLMEQKRGQIGKGALKRERTRIWTEYAVLLWVSVVVIAIASFIEIHLSQVLLHMIGALL